MKYVEFRTEIRNELIDNPDGLTWVELRDGLGLPYERPCPTWVKQLKEDIGLMRSKGEKRAYV